MEPPPKQVPDLMELVGLFYSDPAQLGLFEQVTEDDFPQPYRRLLAHHDHMTVTMEEFHGSRVDVHVLATRRDNGHYSRQITLTRQSDGRVVMFGIPRIKFKFLSADVQREIEREDAPLGRILIEHNVMREVQMTALFRVTPGPELCRLFHLIQTAVTYGRTALLWCNGEPAIELLEIVTPA